MRVQALMFIVVWVALSLALVVGWVNNIIQLVGIINDPVTGMLILRICGIPLVPLGAILGFL